MTEAGKIIVYGGKGALGSKCVTIFKENNFWVATIDFSENPEADYNIILPKNSSLVQQESQILDSISAILDGQKLDAVICVAGGWVGGNVLEQLTQNFEHICRQSIWSSLISATIAANHLKENGVLTLPGSNAALIGTPDMISYGMVKAAVHHLAKSLAGENSGLPNNALVVAILPITLDTETNRKFMPNGDFTTWTPLEFIADMVLNWIKDKDRPINGSLLQLVTKNYITDIFPV